MPFCAQCQKRVSYTRNELCNACQSTWTAAHIQVRLPVTREAAYLLENPDYVRTYTASMHESAVYDVHRSLCEHFRMVKALLNSTRKAARREAVRRNIPLPPVEGIRGGNS